MRRREFVRGLLAMGVTAAVADQLAFAEGLGRAWSGADFVTLTAGPGDEFYGGAFQLGPPRLIDIGEAGDVISVDGVRYSVIALNRQEKWAWLDRPYGVVTPDPPPPEDHRVRWAMGAAWRQKMGGLTPVT